MNSHTFSATSQLKSNFVMKIRDRNDQYKVLTRWYLKKVFPVNHRISVIIEGIKH